jgi:D-3-phosphoglycerate dehydrogenase
MATTLGKPVVVVPADDPEQIARSPHLKRLGELVELRIHRQRPSSSADLIERAADAEILVNSRGAVTWPGEILARLPKLRFITTVSIGTDAIDLAAARERNIIVSNVPGRTAPVVAEHALALMFAAARRVAWTTAQLRAGRWHSKDNVFLQGKMLGVVGAGSIGQRMIQLGRAIGMQVQAWTYRPDAQRAKELGVEFVDLDDLLRTSHVVSIHVKLTEQSRGLIGRRELALMPPGAILVNTARGAIVNADALTASLQNGHLAGAGLDVFDVEPLPLDSPILNCEQVVLTPHSADQNAEGRDLLNGGAVDNVLAFLRGRPQNVVA